MTKGKENTTGTIQEISVIDLLLFDHKFLKECIAVLTDENAPKKKKMSLTRSFLDAVLKHSAAEKKAVYSRLVDHEELHFAVLEAEIEHGIMDHKVKQLRTRLSRVRTLKDEVEAELKVLSELLKNHLMEEESEILPMMKKVVGEKKLGEMGAEFMRLRDLSAKDLKDWPVLQDELIQWKDSVEKISSEFLSKMDKYVENLKH